MKLVSNALLVYRMRRYGIRRPWLTLKAARWARLHLTLACALLEMETGGGINEFGHDPTIFVGAGLVTKAKYLAYKHARQMSGNRLMQGVGPCQLTWWSTQDQADKLGGCWKPYCNMQVGFHHLQENIAHSGLRSGIAAYNGSGPAALHYAVRTLGWEARWATRLKIPSVQ